MTDPDFILFQGSPEFTPVYKLFEGLLKPDDGQMIIPQAFFTRLKPLVLLHDEFAFALNNGCRDMTASLETLRLIEPVVRTLFELNKYIQRGLRNLDSLDDKGMAERAIGVHARLEKFLLLIHGDESSENRVRREGLFKFVFGKWSEKNRNCRLWWYGDFHSWEIQGGFSVRLAISTLNGNRFLEPEKFKEMIDKAMVR